MVFQPGQALQNGQYTVERELGRGRFGITYLTTRADGDRWVIKVLNPQVLDGLPMAERDRYETLLWQEAVKLAKCSGTAHIVRVETPFKQGSVICLPMEYIDAISLADRSQRILVESAALEYIRQIGQALTVVHQQNLVHCDIRPANIFLRLRGNQAEAVLTDFGLTLPCDAELSRTREQERMDGFSPIELYSSRQKVGPYTDVYSLAAMLYELLTGEVPVSAEDRKVRGQQLLSPQVKNPEISGKTAKAILQGMALLPQDRPQSVVAWLKLLGIDQSPAQPTVKNPVDWAKWQTILAGAGVLVTLGVGIPAWLALQKPDSTPTPSPSSSIQSSP